MPAKPMKIKKCDKPGCPKPEFKSQAKHDKFYHSDSPSSPESGGSISDQSSPPDSTIKFQDVDQVMRDKKKQIESGIKPAAPPPGKKGGGGFLGIGQFFITIAEWLNATICKEPKIIMNEKIAARLEKQFNDAFGVYISPMIAFIGSIFFVFGIPILLNLFGKELVTKLILKFKDGLSKKIGDISGDKMRDSRRELPTNVDESEAGLH